MHVFITICNEIWNWTCAISNTHQGNRNHNWFFFSIVKNRALNCIPISSVMIGEMFFFSIPYTNRGSEMYLFDFFRVLIPLYSRCKAKLLQSPYQIITSRLFAHFLPIFLHLCLLMMTQRKFVLITYFKRHLLKYMNIL